MFIIKPLLRVLIDIFNDRVSLLLPYKDEQEVINKINKYLNIIDELEIIINNIKIK